MKNVVQPRVIPVIDLLGGIVVRGVAGRRSEYRPLESQVTRSIEPAIVARDLVHATRATALYVADLDAIQKGQRSLSIYEQMGASGARLWLDVGIASRADALQFCAELAQSGIPADLVIGLESIESAASLVELGAMARDELSGSAIFSVDMRAGQLISVVAELASRTPLELASLAVRSGFTRILLLDLAAVGVASGIPTLALARQLRDAWGSAIEIIVGGGVRSSDDLLAASQAGADAVLVASAIHSRAIRF